MKNLNKEAKELLIPFPDKRYRDGSEIKTWMEGWEIGYEEAQQNLFTEEQVKNLYLGTLQNINTCIKQSDMPTWEQILDYIKQPKVEITFEENKPIKCGNVMKQYFVKYLPIDGKIKEGDIVWVKAYNLRSKVIEIINKSQRDIVLEEMPHMGTFDYRQLRKEKLFLCSRDIQVSDRVFWEKQTYYCDEKYKEYIGKFYNLEKCIGLGLGEIVLKNYYTKKSFEECREAIVDFLKKVNKEKTEEEIDKNAKNNVESSGDLHLKIGYNISENDIIKVIGEISPEATWVKEGDEFDFSELDFTDSEYKDPEDTLIYIKGPCGHFH